MKNLVKGTLVPFILFVSFFWTQAQETHEIKLVNQETMRPIIGATFQYGSQKGVSDKSGNILIYLDSKEIMKLSHLSFGAWELNATAIEKAIKEKVFYKQEDFINLYPVTVLAIRPSEKPIDKIKIDYQEQLAHDATAILTQNPGVSSIKKGGNYGFDPVIRGFKYEQLNIILDGVQSTIAACPNRMDPPTSQMAPNMLDRIEILKGPHALRFGTGFGGTINFIPAQIIFSEKNTYYGRVSSGFEANGDVTRNEAKVGFMNNRLDLAFFGSWSKGNDYTAGNGSAVAANFERSSVGLNLGFKHSALSQFKFSAIHNKARDTDFPALPMDLRKDHTWLLNAKHEIRFEERNLFSWNTALFASFVDHLMDNLLRPEAGRMSNNSTNANTFNYGGRSEGVWIFKESKLYAGTDLKIEEAKGNRERSFFKGPNSGVTLVDNAWQEGVITKGGLFAEYHIKKKNIQYILSSRIVLNHASINKPTKEFIQANGLKNTSTQWNPNISIGLKKPLSESVTLGTWFGRAQRSGSITERFINYFPVGLDPYELVGDPYLLPEKNHQLDVTFEWVGPKSKINIDLFASYLKDFISSYIDTDLNPRLPMSPGVRRYSNIEKAYKTGLEFNWSQELSTQFKHQMGIAYTIAQDVERKEPLPEIAPLDIRYTLMGNHLKGKLQTELSFRHVLEQSRISVEYGETTSPSFSLVDATIGYSIYENTRLSAGVNNLLNKSYNEHLNRSVRGTNEPILAPGRNLFASLNINF